jgi:hypothetical protein
VRNGQGKKGLIKDLCRIGNSDIGRVPRRDHFTGLWTVDRVRKEKSQESDYGLGATHRRILGGNPRAKTQRFEIERENRRAGGQKMSKKLTELTKEEKRHQSHWN